MATETRPVPISDLTGEQLALTTTLNALGVPPKRDTVPCRGVLLRSTADFRLHVNPAIKAFLKTTDTGATYTDYTSQVTDRDTATVATLSSLDTLANGDWLLIGADRQFGGVRFDLDAKNINASVLTGQYWDGSAWQDLTLTDGTISPAGTCLGQDGNITWTLPTDWAQTALNGVVAYWVRLKVSAALDSTVTLAEAALLNKDSSRGYLYGHVLYLVPLGAEDGAIEAILAASTATLDVTWCFGNTLPAIATDQTLLGGGLPAALGAGGGLKVDGSGTAVPVSGTVTAAQTTHDNLNANANMQVGNADVGAANPVSVQAVAGTASLGSVKDDGPAQTVTRTYTQNADISTARDITAAPTAGQKITALDVIVSVNTAAYVTIQMETTGNVLAAAYMAANTTVPFTLRGMLKADAADKKLQMKSSVASAGACTAVYYSEA